MSQRQGRFLFYSELCQNTVVSADCTISHLAAAGCSPLLACEERARVPVLFFHTGESARSPPPLLQQRCGVLSAPLSQHTHTRTRGLSMKLYIT